MGNQPSKSQNNSGTSTPRASLSSERKFSDLESYPSFSKADTKDSAKSLKGALRSKIPSSLPGSRTGSPRGSIAGLPNGESNGDSTDATSVKSGRSGRASLSRLNRSDTPDGPRTPLPDSESVTSPRDESQPPPSPVRSQSVREGVHDVDAAQLSGEVDHVSDQPPSGTANPWSHLQRAGPSILVKKPDAPNPVQNSSVLDMLKALDQEKSTSNVSMSELKESDVDDYITRLLDAGYAGKSTKGVCLRNAEITAICSRVKEIFLRQPPLLELDAPVKIVGDIHGQYSDLIRMFEMCGFPPSSNFLFLGDYVDRGKHSLETILLLMCYKIKYPENFFLLRGNHECANVTRVYGFYDECKRRCNVKIWKTFVDAFNTVYYLHTLRVLTLETNLVF